LVRLLFSIFLTWIMLIGVRLFPLIQLCWSCSMVLRFFDRSWWRFVRCTRRVCVWLVLIQGFVFL